jgi:hypothetical protein
MDVPARHGRDQPVTALFADPPPATLVWVIAGIGVAALIAAGIVAWMSRR